MSWPRSEQSHGLQPRQPGEHPYRAADADGKEQREGGVMAKKLPKNLVAQVKRHKDAIAKHRDALRDLYDDIEEVVGSADMAIQELENAIATLSEYV
jgi:hypothetical protein